MAKFVVSQTLLLLIPPCPGRGALPATGSQPQRQLERQHCVAPQSRSAPIRQPHRRMKEAPSSRRRQLCLPFTAHVTRCASLLVYSLHFELHTGGLCTHTSCVHVVASPISLRPMPVATALALALALDCPRTDTYSIVIFLPVVPVLLYPVPLLVRVLATIFRGG